MLNASSMASQIVANLNHSEKCKTYLQSIKDYVESNIRITGNYFGTTPAGYPDPNNGPVRMKLTITGSMPSGLIIDSFLNGITTEANPNGFIKAIMSECYADRITGVSPHTLTTIAIYTVSSLSNGELNSLANYQNTYQQNWQIICQPIVDSFLSLRSAGPIPTTTPSGSGVTTITSVS